MKRLVAHFGSRLAAMIAVLSLIGCQGIMPPRLETPQITFQSGEAMLLQWNGDPDVSYLVEIGKTDETDPIRFNTNKNSVDIRVYVDGGKLEVGKTHAYRVRQSRVGGPPSDWSAEGQFTLTKYPVPVATDISVDPARRIEVTWEEVPDAPAYSFQLATDDDFEKKRSLLTTRLVSEPVCSLQEDFDDDRDGLEFGKAYYYRVRVMGNRKRMSEQTLSDWSEVRRFTIQQPAVAQIEDVVHDTPGGEVVVSWTRVDYAKHYTLQIFSSLDTRRKPRFEASKLDDIELDITKYATSGKLEYGKDYYYRVRTHIAKRPFDSELKKFRIDIQAPVPHSPVDIIAGDPMPNFSWLKPDIEDCRFDIWIGLNKNTKAPWKRFMSEIDDDGRAWTKKEFAKASRSFKSSLENGKQSSASSLLARDEPEFFAYDKVYFWRIRSIYQEDGSGRNMTGSWSDWVRFRVRRAPPQVTAQARSSRRTTPVVSWEERNWDRKRSLVKRLEVEIVPESSSFNGREDDLVKLDPARVKDGLNNIRLNRRLKPGVRYKWRIRTVYLHGKTSEWGDGGTIALPPNPREQFPTGLIAKTEDIQEWWPTFNADFTKLAYQSGVPSDVPAFGDSVDRSGEKSAKPGSLYQKQLDHDELGMPIPNQARGSLAESWERAARITFMQPAWDPDGRIFFASNQYDTLSYLRMSIMSRRLDAPAQTAVLSASSDDSLIFPDISRDGRKVCFTVAKFDRKKIQEIERYYRSDTNDRDWFESARKDIEGDVSYEIWTANTNGSSKSYLTPGRKGVFSPDGKQIAFLSRDRQGAPWSLWLCSSRGGSLQQIVPPPTINSRLDHPRWSGDGSKITYVSDQAGNDDVWIYDIKTGKRTQITQALDDDRCPVWGKDDRYIMFVSYREGNYDLWYVDVSSMKGDSVTTKPKPDGR